MESNDFDPGPWGGHNFKSARSAYDAHAGRSYSAAVSAGKSKKDLIEPEIVFQASIPLAIISDVTGSMGTDPSVFFSKLGYLEIEGKEYLGDDMEICFGATGDANGDSYPVQVRKPTKGLELKDRLKELIIEGGGGGQEMETYELLALYFNRLAKTPRATRKPILIFIGDEAPYPFINENQAKQLLGIEIKERLSTKTVFEELKNNWSVYLIRRPYGESGNVDTMDPTNRKIYKAWADLLGEDHITTLPDAERVVDIIFGILAEETGKFEYFREEVTQRQIKDEGGAKKVAIVFKSLESIHNPLPIDDSQKKLPGPGRSVTRRNSKNPAKPGKKLI
ncbi:MAG: hypothetical protein WC517_02270 [Patescibacteria group bacterium]